MTLLIQNPKTGLFYKSHGEWILSEDEAKTFSNALSLYHFCHMNGLHDVDIVVKTRDFEQPAVIGKVPFDVITC